MMPRYGNGVLSSCCSAMPAAPSFAVGGAAGAAALAQALHLSHWGIESAATAEAPLRAHDAAVAV